MVRSSVAMSPLRGRLEKYSLCENLCVWPWPSPLSTIHSTRWLISWVRPSAGTPIILKPSEKTPLTAIKFAELLHKNGLPGPMLSVLLGPTQEVAERLQDERVEMVSFTGSVSVGKHIARSAGYKKLVLELGGNDPDHSGRCRSGSGSSLGLRRRFSEFRSALYGRQTHHGSTIHPGKIHSQWWKEPKSYTAGDPHPWRHGFSTVIDESVRHPFGRNHHRAVSDGARVLLGGGRQGALLEPTVIADTTRLRWFAANLLVRWHPSWVSKILTTPSPAPTPPPYGLSSE